MRFLDGASWAWLGLFVGIAIGLPLGGGSISLPDEGGSIIDIVSTKHAGAWVMLVEESGDRSPATARVLASNYFSGLSDRGLKYRLYDVDDSSLDPTVKREAEAAGLPALVIVSKDGSLLYAGNQPPTAEAIDKVVKRETGY